MAATIPMTEVCGVDVVCAELARDARVAVRPDASPGHVWAATARRFTMTSTRRHEVDPSERRVYLATDLDGHFDGIRPWIWVGSAFAARPVRPDEPEYAVYQTFLRDLGAWDCAIPRLLKTRIPALDDSARDTMSRDARLARTFQAIVDRHEGSGSRAAAETAYRLPATYRSAEAVILTGSDGIRVAFNPRVLAGVADFGAGGWISLDGPHRPAVTYRASGTVHGVVMPLRHPATQ